MSTRRAVEAGRRQLQARGLVWQSGVRLYPVGPLRDVLGTHLAGPRPALAELWSSVPLPSVRATLATLGIDLVRQPDAGVAIAAELSAPGRLRDLLGTRSLDEKALLTNIATAGPTASLPPGITPRRTRIPPPPGWLGSACSCPSTRPPWKCRARCGLLQCGPPLWRGAYRPHHRSSSWPRLTRPPWTAPASPRSWRSPGRWPRWPEAGATTRRPLCGPADWASASVPDGP